VAAPFNASNPTAPMLIDSQGCADKRMYYLNRWLDDQASLDSSLDTQSTMTTTTYTLGPWSGITPSNTNTRAHRPTTVATKLTIRVGSKSARAEFDLGDSNLDVNEVRWAMNAIRTKAGQGVFPLPLSLGVRHRRRRLLQRSVGVPRVHAP
jgi:hypothetical protein